MKTRIATVAMLFIGVLLAGCALLGPAPEVDVLPFAIDPAYAVELHAYSDAVSFKWFVADIDGNNGQTLYGKTTECQLDGPGEYVATVIATGSNGLTSTAEMEFSVDFISVTYKQDGPCGSLFPGGCLQTTFRPCDDLR